MSSKNNKIPLEYQKIIQAENLLVDKFTYEVYLGGDITFDKDKKTGYWNISIYQRLLGTPLERLMIIAALGTIKRIEEKWFVDETSPFHQIGPQIESGYYLPDTESKKNTEETLCSIRNGLFYLFETDYLLEKNYFKVEDVIELTKYYMSMSMVSFIFFQFLANVSALRKHKGDVTTFHEIIISQRKYNLLQIIDVQEKMLINLKITKNDIKEIFEFLYPDRARLTSQIILEQKIKEFRGNEKCFVLTEDSKSSELTQIILASNGFKISETLILSYESCSQIGTVKLFSAFVRQRLPDIKIIVHRDRDYLTDDEIKKLQLQFKEIETHLFITLGTDIESHYINKFHVSNSCSEIGIEEAAQLIEMAFETAEEKSIGLLKNKEFGERYKNKSSHLHIALEQLYSNNKLRFSHGKTVYKALKKLIQAKTKKNANLEIPSEHLKILELEEIAKSIWKRT